MKVYVVTKGIYSNYQVCALFSNEQKARAYMKAIHASWGDYNDIEVYELDPPDADFASRGYECWIVHMLRDGEVEKAFTVDSTPDESRIWKRTQAPAYKGKDVPDCLLFQGWAKNKEHAIKSANEKRTQLIALGEWA